MMDHPNDYNQNSHERQFHRSESMPGVTRRLVEMLDHLEQRVELLRDTAAGIQNEKEALTAMLSSVKNHKDLALASEGEREEIELNTKRLLDRTQDVEVSITIRRSEMQQKALDKVNMYINEFVESKSEDIPSSEKLKLISSYLNACLTDCKGPVHQKFQAAILDCTAYDQKQTRKRLENLINSLS